MPAAVDPGPDLLMVLTKVTHDLWPDLKTTTKGKGKGTSPNKTKLQEQLSQQKSEILALLTVLSEDTGKTIEQIAEERGITLPNPD